VKGVFLKEKNHYEYNEAKAAFFDAQADASWVISNYTESERSRLEQVFEVLPALLNCTVLEPGCGAGRLTEILAEKVGPEGLVLAMDISENMIQKARTRLGCRENVRILCASLESCAFPGPMVDLVFCHQVFPHFDCKETALRIMSACLKPGGFFVIFHLMGIEQINDLHRKAGTPVARDIMPSNRAMEQMLTRFGLRIEKIEDQNDRYLILAQKTQRV